MTITDKILRLPSLIIVPVGNDKEGTISTNFRHFYFRIFREGGEIRLGYVLDNNAKGWYNPYLEKYCDFLWLNENIMNNNALRSSLDYLFVFLVEKHFI